MTYRETEYYDADKLKQMIEDGKPVPFIIQKSRRLWNDPPSVGIQIIVPEECEDRIMHVKVEFDIDPPAQEVRE